MLKICIKISQKAIDKRRPIWYIITRKGESDVQVSLIDQMSIQSETTSPPRPHVRSTKRGNVPTDCTSSVRLPKAGEYFWLGSRVPKTGGNGAETGICGKRGKQLMLDNKNEQE